MRPLECECFQPDETVLRDFQFWQARFNTRQDYPGKVLLVLRRHVEDVLGLTQDERDELWQAAALLRDSVHRMLQPDWWNYMFLGNLDRHVHLHMIPRYATPRVMQGWEFVDRHWGALHVRQESPPVEVYTWLLIRLKEELARLSNGLQGDQRFADGTERDSVWRHLRGDLLRRDEFLGLRRRVEEVERRLGLKS